MERVRDFSPYELKVSVYDGAAEKRTMLMDGHLYMVKFGYDAAPQEEHPSRTSYVNLPVNEYMLQGVRRFGHPHAGCHSR